MFKSVLCHRCSSTVKLNQFKSTILPERRMRTFFHQLPHTVAGDRTRAPSPKPEEGRTKAPEKIPFGGHLQLHCLNQWWNHACRLPWWLWANYVISSHFHFPQVKSEQWYFTTCQVCNKDSYRHDKACKTQEYRKHIQISKIMGILYQYLKLL